MIIEKISICEVYKIVKEAQYKNAEDKNDSYPCIFMDFDEAKEFMIKQAAEEMPIDMNRHYEIDRFSKRHFLKYYTPDGKKIKDGDLEYAMYRIVPCILQEIG